MNARVRWSADPGPTTSRWILVGCILLAAVLRLYGLDIQPLWLDELYTWNFATGPLHRLIVEGAAQDVHPPGHMLLMHYWLRLLGDSPTALRMPSALAGIAVVPLLYLLARGLRFDRGVGLRVAALATVSWFPLYYSQEGRAYSLVLLLVVGLALLSVRAVRAHAEGRSSIALLSGAVLLAVCLSYLHYYGLLFVLMLAGLLAYLAFCDALPKAPVFVACFVGALAYLPWLRVVLSQAKRGRDASLPKWKFLISLSRDLTSGHRALCLVIFLAGLYLTFKRAEATQRPAWRPKLLFAWIVLPIVASYAISWLVAPVYSVRNLIIIYPALLLGLASCLSVIDRSLPVRAPWASAATAGVLLWDLLITRGYYTTTTKEDVRSLAQTIARQSSDEKLTRIEWLPSSSAWMLDTYFELLRLPYRVAQGARGDSSPELLWIITRRTDLSAAPLGYHQVNRREYTGQRNGNWSPAPLFLYQFERDQIRPGT